MRDSALRPQKLGKCSESVRWFSLALISEGVAKLGAGLYIKVVVILVK